MAGTYNDKAFQRKTINLKNMQQAKILLNHLSLSKCYNEYSYEIL